MDEELQEGHTPPDGAESKRRSRKTRKEKDSEAPKPFAFPDPQAAHKKFMAAMIGIFLFFLAMMLFLNEYMDFAVDGGI